MQEQSAHSYAQRRIGDLVERIEKLKRSGKLQMIPAFEGQLKKAERELNMKVGKIKERRNVDPDLVELAVGVIVVER